MDLTQRQSTRALIIAALYLAFFFVYRDAFCKGDALVYADNILRHRFDDISVHLGYYLLGDVFYRLLSPFGLPIDRCLILMSVLLGAVGTAYAYLLAQRLTGDSLIGVLCCVVLASSGAFIQYASGAEVYIAQTAFLLASMYYFLKKRMILAGLLYATAMLITPLTVFAAPFYIFIWLRDKTSARNLLLFALSFLVLYLPLFFWVYHDLLWGRRGLLTMALNTPHISVVASLKSLVLVFGKSFHILAPFLVVGYIVLYRKNRALLLMINLVLLCQVYLLLKAREPSALESFLLDIYFFPALAIAIGVGATLTALFRKPRVRAYFAAAIVVVYSLISLVFRVGPAGVLSPSLHKVNQYGEDFKALAAVLKPDDALIADFNTGVAFSFYTRSDPSEELETTMGNPRWVNADYMNAAKFATVMRSHERVFIVESYLPSPGATLMFSREQLEKRYLEHSLKSRFDQLATECHCAVLERFMAMDLLRVYRAVPQEQEEI